MFSSFYEKVELKTEHILTSISETTPQSSNESEDMLRIKEWMKNRARPVTEEDSGEIVKTPSKLSLIKRTENMRKYGREIRTEIQRIQAIHPKRRRIEDAEGIPWKVIRDLSQYGKMGKRNSRLMTLVRKQYFLRKTTWKR
jgi:hypothetical protein